MRIPRLSSGALCLLGLLFLAPSAAAQSAASIVEEMRARYEKQLETVDTYIVETNLHTTYNRKVTRGGRPTYETATEIRGQSPALREMSSTSPESIDPAFLDRLAQHATYAGRETISGVDSHVLRVDTPSAVIDDGEEVREVVFYVHPDTYTFARMRMVTAPTNADGQAVTLTMDFADYRTVDGLTLPFKMTITTNLNLSDDQRRQMKQMQEQLDQMSEQQREQMKRMMGNQFEQMQKMMSGEPTTIEVQSVRVNEGIPEGIFEDSGSNR